MDGAQAFEALRDIMREIETLRGVSALLSWDQQTHMPSAGASGRGRQLAMLDRMLHARDSDPAIREHAARLAKSEDPLHQRTAEVVLRQAERAARIPPELVARASKARSEAFEAWKSAKQDSDFSLFAPHLRELVDVSIAEANAVDPERHPYDVLLEIYDPGTTVESLRPMFARLREGLVELIDAVRDAEHTVEESPIAVPTDVQRAIHHEIADALGYDFQAGRLDEAPHPFTIDISAGDVRITTAYHEEDLLAGLGGTVHEVGHALYEQGLPRETLDGTRLSEAASMGMHESQSRFWENAIGRSHAFSVWLAGRLRAHMGDEAPDADTLYSQQNRVSPGLIRIFADEVTYNLHIIVRFELELALIEGTLAVEDVPEAWNKAYAETLGVEVPDDARGCLQDVHWAHAAFGYFPSYTLGNLYAASLLATLEGGRGSLWDEVQSGKFGPVLAWLRHQVHSQGRLLDAPDLVAQICGERDHVEDLLAYLWGRHGALYGLTRPE